MASVKVFKNFRLVSSDFVNTQKKQAFVVENGIITWIGNQSKIPKIKTSKNVKIIDLKNQLVFPSFVECHTHTVFAGTRADEFEMRNRGVSYVEIAKKGGGIISTMKHTRKASAADLLKLTQERVDVFVKQGVSTLEIKSGYSLDLKNEIKMLEVLKKIKGPQIVSTYLGAHAKPPEFSTHADYIKYLCEIVLPAVKKKNLAERVDIFVEKHFFEKPESEMYLKKAQQLGFKITIHANQLTLSEGLDLAIDFKAQSADHVIQLDDRLIQKVAKSKTTCVLLPAADLYMKCAYPPARKLIDAGATVALATDFNPGSCPTQDLSLVGVLARLEMKMSLPEVFQAYTVNAAAALGLQAEQGTLTVGKLANFISTDADLTDFFYSVGFVPNHQLFIRGSRITT